MNKEKQKGWIISVFLLFSFLASLVILQSPLTSGQLKLTKKEVTKTDSGSLKRDFNLIGSTREVIEFEVATGGKIEARAEWSGTASSLALILNGPGRAQAYARQDGKSPLTLSFAVTSEIVSLGKSWKLSIVNFDSRTNAQGVVQISYPAEALPAIEKPAAAESPRRPSFRPAEKPSRKIEKKEMIWSSISMREPDPSRKHNPPALSVPMSSLKSPEPMRIKDKLVKINKRQPLSFQPFEVVDPATGSPVDPETTLTLPNGRQLPAKDYYEQLNKLEESFNRIGYSLNLKRDPVQQVKLQEISLSQAEINANLQRARTILEAHKFQERPVPVSVENLRRDFRTRFTEDRERLRRIQKYRGSIHGPTAPDGQVAQPFEKTEQKSLDFGYKDLFAVYLNSKVSGYGDQDMARFNCEAEAGGYIFSKQARLLRVAASASSPSSGGEMKVNLTAYVLGVAYNIVDEKKPIPGVPLDQIPQVPSVDVASEWSIDKDISFGTSFPLGPFMLSVTVGTRFSAGAEYGLFLTPLYARGQVGPFVSSEVFAQVGLDLIIAEPGVRCILTLLYNSLIMESKVELDADDRGPFVAAIISCYDELEALSGELEIYVCVYVPAWDWPPWKKKCWSWDIARWEGLKGKGYLFAYDYKKHIFETGPGETTSTAKEGESFEVSGELAGKWLPEAGSGSDPGLTDQPFPPALAAFGIRLFKFWEKDASHLWYSSSDARVYAKKEQKTKKIQDKETGRWEEYKVWEDTYYMNWTEPASVGWIAMPACACAAGNRLYVFVQGSDAIYYKIMDQSGRWYPELQPIKIDLGKKLTVGLRPSAVVRRNDLFLFYIIDNKIHFRWANIPAGNEPLQFTQDLSLSEGKTSGSPSATVFKDCVFVFYKGYTKNDIFYQYLADHWSSEKKVGNISTSVHPQAVVHNERLYVFGATGDKPIKYRVAEDFPDPWKRGGGGWPEPRWENVKEITGSKTYELAACVAANSIFIFHRGTGTTSGDISWRCLKFQ